MTRLLALWRKEFIALSRDRHGLLALFLMPAIFVLVMSLALRDGFTPNLGRALSYAVLDEDGSAEAKAFINLLAQGGALSLATQASAERVALRAALREGRLGFVLHVPQGFGRTLLETPRGDGPRLAIWADPALAPPQHAAFRQQVLGALGRVQAQTLVARLTGREGMAIAADASHAVTVETVQAGDQAVLPSAVQQSVPAWLIFAMFFVVIPMSALFIIERQEGTLQRLKTQGVPFSAILAGKLLPFFVINQVQAILMVGVGRYLVPLLGGEALELPQALPALWAMSAAVSLAAVCWALLIASLARTAEQATIVGGVGNILMGAIGGVMVPKFIMPPFMQALTVVSPMAWGLEGFHVVMLRGGGLFAVLPYAAALTALALAALALAVFANGRVGRATQAPERTQSAKRDHPLPPEGGWGEGTPSAPARPPVGRATQAPERTQSAKRDHPLPPEGGGGKDQ
ncbi:Linearmycin resistance permease protein LnrM [Burkholderiales bacterium]|nr:Linearmycin resistance permease protein LnrM [Burkholderiales bacterium]